ncbi:hypothetical protein Tco_1483341 [Tanacetum coccineum]
MACLLKIDNIYGLRNVIQQLYEPVNEVRAKGEAKTTSTPTSPTSQAQVTYVSESVVLSVAPANQLKIGKCNLRLSSDVTSKVATLQVVYDVLKLTPFYKAFQVSADVPEIYMQGKDILQIFPKVGNEKFEEPPLEKKILAFLASLGHSGEIKRSTDVKSQ